MMPKLLSLTLFFIISICFALLEVVNFDEATNFRIAHAIANGAVPYQDIFMIASPFSFQFLALLIQLFGPNLLVYRLLYACILFCVAVLLHAAIQKYHPKQGLLPITLPLFSMVLLTIADNNIYNLMAALFLCLLAYVEFESKEQHFFLKGLLIGLLVITKQHIGLLAVCAFVLYHLWLKTSKNAMLQGFLGTLVPLIAEGAYVGMYVSYPALQETLLNGAATYARSKIQAFLSMQYPSDILLAATFILLFNLWVLAAVYLKYRRDRGPSLRCLSLYGACYIGFCFPLFDIAHTSLFFFMLPFLLLQLFQASFLKKTAPLFLLLFLLPLLYKISNLHPQDYRHSLSPQLQGIAIAPKEVAEIQALKEYLQVQAIDFNDALMLHPILQPIVDMALEKKPVYYPTLEKFIPDSPYHFASITQSLTKNKKAVILLNTAYDDYGLGPLQVEAWVRQHFQKKKDLGSFEIYTHRENSLLQ